MEERSGLGLRGRVSKNTIERKNFLTGFSPGVGFCLGCWPTFGALDLCVFALIFA